MAAASSADGQNKNEDPKKETPTLTNEEIVEVVMSLKTSIDNSRKENLELVSAITGLDQKMTLLAANTEKRFDKMQNDVDKLAGMFKDLNTNVEQVNGDMTSVKDLIAKFGGRLARAMIVPNGKNCVEGASPICLSEKIHLSASRDPDTAD